MFVAFIKNALNIIIRLFQGEIESEETDFLLQDKEAAAGDSFVYGVINEFEKYALFSCKYGKKITLDEYIDCLFAYTCLRLSKENLERFNRIMDSFATKRFKSDIKLPKIITMLLLHDKKTASYEINPLIWELKGNSNDFLEKLDQKVQEIRVISKSRQISV